MLEWNNPERDLYTYEFNEYSLTIDKPKKCAFYHLEIFKNGVLVRKDVLLLDVESSKRIAKIAFQNYLYHELFKCKKYIEELEQGK